MATPKGVTKAPEPRRIHRKKWVRLGFAVFVAADTEANATHLAGRLQRLMRKQVPSSKLSFGELGQLPPTPQSIQAYKDATQGS